MPRRSAELRTCALLVLTYALAVFQSADAIAQNIFTLVATPSSHRVNQGANVPITISTAVVSGSAEAITLSTSGLPAGVTPSFSPNPVTAGGTSNLTLTADNMAVPSIAAVVTVTGVSASDTEGTTFALTVEDIIFRESFDGAPRGCTSMPLTWAIPATTYTGQPSEHPGGDVNMGDVLTLNSNPIDANSCLNDTPAVTPYTYAWSIVAKPPGSNPSLSGATSAQPTFVPDVPAGQYTIQAIVTDALGNATPPAFLSMVTSFCGASPVVVTVTVVPGNLETDPINLSASATDLDATGCPLRFVPNHFTYLWTVISSPPSSTWAFSYNSLVGAPGQYVYTTFRPSEGGAYDLRVYATASSNNTQGFAGVHYLYEVATATTLASDNNPSLFGQSVTFTATVAVVAPGIGMPTGTVTFNDSEGIIGSACGAQSMSGGIATCTTSALTASGSPDSVTATYNGDPYSLPSTSDTVNQIVDNAATTITVSSDNNPSALGQSVTFTATVVAVAPAGGIPTGTVTFQDDGVDLGGCSSNTLNSGTATCTTTALSVGTHAITANYNADSNFSSSASSALNQTVN
jgi:hypothetical protein